MASSSSQVDIPSVVCYTKITYLTKEWEEEKIIIYKPVTNNGNLMEKKLFVNTIIAAYNAQAVNPELMFVKQSDRNAAQEKTVYYTLDNVNFNESQELIKNKPLEFHLK